MNSPCPVHAVNKVIAYRSAEQLWKGLWFNIEYGCTFVQAFQTHSHSYGTFVESLITKDVNFEFLPKKEFLAFVGPNFHTFSYFQPVLGL